MIRILLLSFLFSCQSKTSKDAVKPIPKEPKLKKSPEGKLSIDDLHKAFSMKHYTADCDNLREHMSDFDQALVTIVQDYSYPPWAPMHAADCLIKSQSPLAKEEMLRWLSDPNTMGLAIKMANQLSQIESDFSQELVEAGLKGPHKLEFEKRLSARKGELETEKNISNDQQ